MRIHVVMNIVDLLYQNLYFFLWQQYIYAGNLSECNLITNIEQVFHAINNIVFSGM